MSITNIPPDYSGVYSQVVYTVDGCSPYSVTDVELLSESGGVKAVKRFYGETCYDVNVAGYLKREVDVEPAQNLPSGIYRIDGRATVARIRVGGLVSSQSIVTAGVLSSQEGCLSSNAPTAVRIAPGQKDEVTFAAGGGLMVTARFSLEGATGRKEFEKTYLTSKKGIYTLVVNTDDIPNALGLTGWDGYEQLSVEIVVGTDSVGNRVYEISEAIGGVRMHWVNPYGAIDSYTFLPVVEKTISTSRNRIYGREGYQTCSLESETVISLQSEYETEKTIAWLSEILCSPKAWMESGDGLHSVDIVTGSGILKADIPIAVALKIRPAKKTVTYSR